MFGFFKRKKQQEEQQRSLDQGPEGLTEEEATEASSAKEAAREPAPSEPAILEEQRPEEVAMAGPAADEELARTESVDEVGREEENAALASGQADGEAPSEAAPSPEAGSAPAPVRTPEQEKPAGETKGWFSRIRAGLGKTRTNLTDGIAELFLGKKQIDDELIEDLETQLLMADVGIEATTEIIDRLAERVSRKELKDPQALYRALQDELTVMLDSVAKPLALPPRGEGPFVILVVGVNGVGKTTTIGKLTQRFQREGRSVMLAAGDTFRAAAVEQLKVWGERNSVPVIAQHTGADSASVIFDAVAAAKARKIDVLIADTAGRLHNKGHLMEELKKVHRVMGKLDDTAPHEVMLVLDAGTGQNAISQAATFNEAVPVTGITLTKLDGTAKGGIIFALAKQLGTPIRFIGVGESLDDLRPFEARDFVDALFDQGDERDAASA
ncbi:signal recognition particle-docking protein FtsY [Billgrantia endophytica]|uniref:Signal recognition particle receptor FtsY n=1 Tax=Billgrantia endophytica TaxID=2033802 RepID=A0A2N7U716_9GAMM|nr:signal recognition particle-docking protein FtsY [Halomonas endophytica]PMR76224.1 signal recognition particle-docking protein FtsY [Halomonas endophytica]